MFTFIKKYLAIGLLLGVGIEAVNAFTWHFHFKKEQQDLMVERQESFEELRKLFYVEGLDNIFEQPDNEYNPGVGLSFSMEGYKHLGDKIEVRGIVANVGTVIWDSLFLEIEAFDSHGRIIAECNESTRNIKPGHWESIIAECNIVDDRIDTPIEEVTFKIKKAFAGKTVVKPREQ